MVVYPPPRIKMGGGAVLHRSCATCCSWRRSFDYEGRRNRPPVDPACAPLHDWLGTSFRGGPGAQALDRQILALTGKGIDGIRGRLCAGQRRNTPIPGISRDAEAALLVRPISMPEQGNRDQRHRQDAQANHHSCEPPVLHHGCGV
jgi:hypothetical protein